MEPSSREEGARPRTAAPAGSLRRSVLLFVLCLGVYHSNLRDCSSYDSLATRLLPFNLWQGKGFLLDDQAGRWPHAASYSLIRSREGHLVSAYPVVTPLLVAPLYFPAALLPAFNPNAPGHGYLLQVLMEKLAASILTALSVVVLERVLRQLTSARAALWLSVVYAFGTPAWSISSQALWMHGTSQLLLAGALWFLVRGQPTGWRGAALGLLAGLLTANRPLNLFFSLAIAWIVWRRTGRRCWPFAAVAATMALLLAGYNLHFFSSLAGGYGDFEQITPADLEPRWPTLESISGLLVSNRGLLVFCPFLLALVAWRRPAGQSAEEAAVLAAAWGLNLLGYASFVFWHGGYTYGPRYLSDGLPLLFFFLAPALARCRGLGSRIALGAAAVFAVVLQAIGAFCFSGGGAGNGEWLGFWNVSRSAPVLALASGLRSPDFLPTWVPGPRMAATLDPLAARAELRWVEAPPVDWPAGTARRLEIALENRSDAVWSSRGGLFGHHAVRLLLTWRNTGDADLPDWQLDRWLALELAPGETLRRRLWVAPPPTPGEYLLTLEPVQRELPGLVPFTAPGARALRERVTIGAVASAQPVPLGQPIFADGFENGTVDAWSSAKP